MEFLIANGADVDAKNKNGDAAVNAAIRAGHGDVVELLLSAASNVETTTTTINE